MRELKIFLFLALLSLGGSERLSRMIRRWTGRNRLPPPPPPYVNNVRTPSEHWFEQTLDHSNPTDNRTWQQRYFINDQLYKANGPMFMMIEGEGEAAPRWLEIGSMADYAQKKNAMLIQLEHRFYGKSQPTNDTSLENLRYLTSEQALADCAEFISAVNSDPARYLGEGEWAPFRWVVFGGSYAGNLAAWLRLKYPHLVYAAMSASGPLLAKVDFFEYVNVVKASLDTYSTNCSLAVRNGNYMVMSHINSEIGRHSVQNLFRLCESIDATNRHDVTELVEGLADNIAGVVQYNKDNRMSRKKAITIDTVCGIMTNTSIGDSMHRYAAVNSLLMSVYGEVCIPFSYETIIEELRDTSWDSIAVMVGARQWIYQTCTEFGYYQTSESKDQLFRMGFPLQFFLDICNDTYGISAEMVYRGVNRTNTIYGGQDLQVKKVVFVHGSIDPWHALGKTQSDDPEAPAIYIKGAAHCANMYPPDISDSPELVEAREMIEEYLDKWLVMGE